MTEFTEMTIYMVKYQCFKKDVLWDEYPVGYFVTPEEARIFVEKDIEECENIGVIEEKYRIIGLDRDPDYKHAYLLRKVSVGRPCPLDFSEIEAWT